MISNFKNITSGKKKFDTARKPNKPNPFWHFLQNIIAPFFYVPCHGKVEKINCKGLKPPYLVLSNHASMVDFALAVKATAPYSTSFVSSIEEFIAREYMFREMGMIYKRKFTNDITVVRHIAHVLMKNKNLLK